jgi:hypothetical protein
MAKHSDQPPARRPTAPKEPQNVTAAAEVAESIGRQLKAMFDDVVAEPVPERFHTLLKELEHKSRKP